MAPKRAASASFSNQSAIPINEPNVNAKAGSSKRTRFASPNNAGLTENGHDERATMAQFAEQVDASLEDGLTTRTRRTRVKVDGYESDSTDDGEGVVESRKGKKEGEDDEDDADLDMFAPEDNSEKDKAKDLGKKKKTEYLGLGDIEGQEFGNEGSQDEMSSEDDFEDEDDEERRKKAGMGFEMSGFNMKEEMEEGKFDADGTFIRSHDPHAIHDRWMEGVNEKEIKKARKIKKLREKEERERQAKEEENMVSKEEGEKELVGYLKKSETVLEALQRLGAAAKKHKHKPSYPNNLSKQKRGVEMDVDQASSHSVENAIQNTISRITSLASILMSHGNIDIYSWTYEQLLRSVRAAGEVQPDWVPPSHSAIYEYKWAAVGDSGGGGGGGGGDGSQLSPQIYGPYREEELLSWYGASYFGDAGEKIQLRRIGENEWSSWDEVMF